MDTVGRTPELVRVGFYLSAFGQKVGSQVLPPKELLTNNWNNAYAIFYDALNQGRSLRSFQNTLKATRDAFDSHIPGSGRKGWRLDDGSAKPLNKIEEEIFNSISTLSQSQIWKSIEPFADRDVAQAPKSVLEDIDSIEGIEGPSKTEGGQKVVVSTRAERNLSLRAAAFRIHRYDCMVCGFNFQQVYGDWGKDFSEVHHLIALSSSKTPRKTDPKTDLAVLCANCHRMIHRKRDIVLSLDELRMKLKHPKFTSQ